MACESFLHSPNLSTGPVTLVAVTGISKAAETADSPHASICSADAIESGDALCPQPGAVRGAAGENLSGPFLTCPRLTLAPFLCLAADAPWCVPRRCPG